MWRTASHHRHGEGIEDPGWCTHGRVHWCTLAKGAGGRRTLSKTIALIVNRRITMRCICLLPAQ
eukprot:8000062-Karenia_brevis.AAC.1